MATSLNFKLLSKSGCRKPAPMNLNLLRQRGYIEYTHGGNAKLAEFNAYKHCFTNYSALMLVLTQSNIPVSDSIKIIGKIYNQLLDLVAPKYIPAVRQAWFLTTTAFKHRHQEVTDKQTIDF